ncbi:hypothetical protein FB451DRAFT_1167185 [Mycena latifolia]|nr:hypothetical protein FB451DRAFT_1167185 [Mycena latifolia]
MPAPSCPTQLHAATVSTIVRSLERASHGPNESEQFTMPHVSDEDVMASDDVVFALLSSSQRPHPRPTDHPLDKDNAACDVSVFWAILEIAFRRHPLHNRALRNWMSSWVYPLLEVGVQHILSVRLAKVVSARPTRRLPATRIPAVNRHLSGLQRLAKVCADLKSGAEYY